MASSIPEGLQKHTLNCLNCSHTWLYHFDYDEYLDRYVATGYCEHFSGCSCNQWRDPGKEREKEKENGD